jgi:molybdopterin-guanine dinucleotide biosynthesis protein A
VLTRDRITLGILAGGRARRLGGTDKAFAIFEDEELLSRSLEAVGTGFAEILVSYNGTDQRALEIGLKVVPDLRPGFPGPLAGLEALLQATESDWLMTIPVDLRNIPKALPEDLCLALEQEGQGSSLSPIGNPALARSFDGVAVIDADGLQPLVALWRVSAARDAATVALNSNQLAVHRLLETLRFTTHDLSSWRFGNLNTPADFE